MKERLLLKLRTNRKDESMKKKKVFALILSSLLLVTVIGGYFYLNDEKPLMGVDSSAVNWNGKKNKSLTNESDSIAIPGFTELNFDSNTKEQQVNFYNPEINDCYFKLSLLTLEGERLWQSELIEPGKGLYTIELERELPVGTMNDVVLKYECFTFDKSQSPLNGSEINLTIHIV